MTLPVTDWPLSGMVDDIRPALAQAVAAGRATVLATLAKVDGGGPRPPGAQMLFTADAATGFLSGGCVEGDVALHAAACLGDGEPRTLVYGEGGPVDIRLVCGARIDVRLERLAPDDPALLSLLRHTAERRPALWLSDGRTRACLAAGESTPAALARPGTLRRAYTPRHRLIVVGADPIALATASLGAQAGLETTLVRPLGPEAPPPLPGVAYSRAAPAAALAEIGVDRWTAVAVATHDLTLDEAALAVALRSPAAYVGALGARRRAPERLARLRALGLTETQLARLHAPIGLPLGGKAPWEIAIAILAEVTQAFHTKGAEADDRRAPSLAAA